MIEEKEENLIYEITIPEYPREIIVSKKRKEKYFIREEIKKPLPLKYCDKAIYKAANVRQINDKEYRWIPFKLIRNKKKIELYFLCDLKGNKIVSNPIVAGSEKRKLINGSDVYRLSIPIYDLTKIKNALKEVFIKAVKDLRPINDYPIIVNCELFDTVIDTIGKDRDWDVDNRFMLYGKYFMDVLAGSRDTAGNKVIHKTNRVIVDDNRRYVTGPPRVLFTPITDTKDRKLVFKIYKDTRKGIKDILFLDSDLPFEIIQKQRIPFPNLLL